MTSLDLAFTYGDERATRLSQSAQRVLMALLTLALLERCCCPPPCSTG